MINATYFLVSIRSVMKSISIRERYISTKNKTEPFHVTNIMQPEVFVLLLATNAPKRLNVFSYLKRSLNLRRQIFIGNKQDQPTFSFEGIKQQ